MHPMSFGRLLVAILVGLVVSATAVLAFSAGSQTPPATQAPPFELQPLRVGDQGRYVDGEHELLFRFDEESWPQADGSVARGLVLTVEEDWAQGRFFIVDNEVQAIDEFLGAGGSGSGFWVGDVGVLGMAFYEARQVSYEPGQAPCGLLLRLQALDLEAPGCGALTLLQSNGTAASFAGPSSQVQVEPGFPVATRVQANGRDWVLAAFQAGGRLPANDPAGPVSQLDFEAGRIPAEAGIDHPFPLSQALLFALDLPSTSPLRAFYDEHPRAYLAAASFQEVVEPGRRAYNWTIVATDGQDRIAVVASQAAAQADDPPLTLPVGTGVVLPAVPVPVLVEVPAPAGAYPAPDVPRPAFATLSSLHERWSASAPARAQLDGINAYGFNVDCADDCTEAHTTTWIGIDRIRSRQAPQTPACLTIACDASRWVWVVERLEADDAGQTTHRLYSDWVLYDETSGPFGALTVGDERQSGAPSPEPSQTLAASLWSLPGGPVATGAGLLGVLSAVACYLWPQLKGLLAGFWRSTPTHPTRLALLQAVEANPGIHFQALCRQVDLPAGTVRHHVRRLVRDGQLHAHPGSGFVCYTARTAGRGLGQAAHALKAPSARRILHGVLEAGQLSMAQAAGLAGLDPSTATHHVQRLEQAGLLRRARSGRHVHLTATSQASSALASLGS